MLDQKNVTKVTMDVRILIFAEKKENEMFYDRNVPFLTRRKKHVLFILMSLLIQ
jgi:hypothetical protein